MALEFRIGIDLGGTKTEIIALDDRGKELYRRRQPTPASSYTAIIATIGTLIADCEKTLGGRGSIGLATPGATSPATGLHKNSNTTCLNGRLFQRDLEQALARPVRLANDANCFALSEAVDGAASGCDVVFGVILGTGVGGGVVVHGRPLRGINAIAGEWGHIPLPGAAADETPGPACYCGRRGCVETFLCGPALARDAAAAGLAEASPAGVAAAAEAGDAAALATMRRYEDRLARALAVIINILDPDAIVLGGGLANIDRLYREVPALWGRDVFSDQVATMLRKATFGDSSGVRGAAWLW